MKVLFIGGTGNISSAVSRLAVDRGIELYHLNRGNLSLIPGVKTIISDINNASTVAHEIHSHEWDAVVNWIAFTPEDIQRDISLFNGKTKQYIFISSASCYQKPLLHPVVTESTPLYNPIWDYSQNKIFCEEALNQAYREQGFPITIVRPSLTYDTVIPVSIGGFREFTTAQRMLEGKEIIVQGDGTSLWTVTHADDFALGFVGLLGHFQAIGHAFHITSDEILSWDSIYKILASSLGVEAKITHVPSELICKIAPLFTGTLLGDKAHSCIFDNSKVKSFVPDFKATISFTDGIRRTLDWLNEKEERKYFNHATNDRIELILREYGKSFSF